MVKASRKALQIAFGYLIFAALWIFFSDAAVELAVRDSDILTRVQNIKGFAFVLVTAVLLFIFVRRIFAEVEKSHQREMRSARLLNHYLRRTPVIGYALRVQVTLAARIF